MYIHVKDSKIINTEQVGIISIVKRYRKSGYEWFLTASSGAEGCIISIYETESEAEIALNSIMGAIKDGAKTFDLDTFSY